MPDPNETALVHWTYSRDEWKNFVRWKKKKRGLFHYLWHRLFSSPHHKTPEITISAGQVSTDDKHEPFHDTDHSLQRINIRDAGEMNIMEISYRKNDLNSSAPNEIHILVPKGRLKEAIGVEEKLNRLRDAIR